MDHQHTADLKTNSTSLFEYFSQADFMPHGHCYLWKPGLVYAHVISDILIGLAYVSISIILYALVKKIKIQFDRIVLSFGVFIAACGLTHFLEVWNLWNADYWFSAWIKVLTAAASVTTGVYLFKLRHGLVQVAEATKLAEERRLDLELLTRDLEERVEERTKELTLAIRARDEFLSMASHELKTPLTSLKLHTQLQVKKLKQDASYILENDKAKKFMTMVESQNERLSRLVDDMLDVARIQSGKLELNLISSNVCDVVDEFVQRFKPHFDERQMSLQYQNCKRAYAKIDIFRLDQVLSNLMSNALKYAPDKPVSIDVKVVDSHVLISIQDQGKGIEKEFLEKIFLRFERVASQNGPSGLGLGLYISREIIHAHGGTLWAESNRGEGSTFFIKLPVSG